MGDLRPELATEHPPSRQSMKRLDLIAAVSCSSSSRDLPSLREFSRRFRRKYGRRMTQDERRFFHLVADLIENPPPGPPQRDPKLPG
jgi:hypothetical protein